ncbi:MAG: potassium transporter [Nitrospirae bacterium RBG_19FT_COMBO_55_12]|nr:MAG: potassium transporter [Nitrospirae bacterium RBG_19FT_COMBO_55_12]
MQGEGFFFQAFVYLAAAVILVPIAKRLGLGSVLGYLIAGFIIGPYGLALIGGDGQDVMHFAEFGVIMMLFLIGLELQPLMLWRMRGPILGMGGLQVAATTLVITLLARALGLSFQAALAIGMILSLSSTAIVLQTLNEKGLMQTDAGQSSFSVLLFQDIAVIPMLAVMPLLAMKAAGAGDQSTGHASDVAATWFGALPGWAHALAVLGVITAIVIAGLFLVRPIFRAIARTRLREIFTAAALLLVIGIALLMTSIGLSPALGTFLAGVVLANSEYRHELESDIEPFKGLLLGLFFLSVGASIDFQLIASKPGLIAVLVVGLILIKLLIVLALGRAFRMGADQNMLFAFALAQGGEFAFVLFSFAVQNRVMTSETANPLIGAVALSMALTPLLMLLNEKMFQPRFGTREQQQRDADAINGQNPVIIAGFGGFGSIIGRLLRANGISVTVLELDSDKVDLLRKLGLKVFYGDASRRDLLHAAGADKAKVLVLAINDRNKMMEMIHTAKKEFPHLSLFARAVDRTQAYELLDAGVHHVYRETLDTSLRAGVDALRELGFRSHQAHRASMTFRQHDENAVAELRHLRHDKKEYISHARRKIEDLEELLLSELKDPAEHLDAGWDSASFIVEPGEKKKEGGEPGNG